MECSQCHRPLPADARFCLYCGTPAPQSTETVSPQRIGAIAVNAKNGTSVINIGAGAAAGPTAPHGDCCPICGAFNLRESTFRCGRCGRAFLCLIHLDPVTLWCLECTAREDAETRGRRKTELRRGQPAAGTTRSVGGAGLTLVYVPGGTFAMGSEDSSNGDELRHRITLGGFWIGQTQVINAQYCRFVDAGGYGTRSYWSDEGWKWRESGKVEGPKYWGDSKWNASVLPVLGVCWYEAEAYCAWAGLRLPTEAEWEYAARGGPLSKGFTYAGGNEPGEVAWYGENSKGRTNPVGQKKPNELGLYDMSGNVCEWCSDWHGVGYYRWSPAVNPCGVPGGIKRVMRGGSWLRAVEHLRVAGRAMQAPDDRNLDVGFRVAGPSLA